METTKERLIRRIMVLNERVWERRCPQPVIDAWLANFTGRVADVETERLHALFWLSEFLYYGSKEIRVLLRALYRDLYFCPMVQAERRALPPGSSFNDFHRAVESAFNQTTFFGVGNPSESGIHLLYYFRQENGLAKEKFMDVAQIFSRSDTGQQVIRKPEIKRYIFLDDICGSGDTATSYSENIIEDLLRLDPQIKIAYCALFGSSSGLARVRRDTLFKDSTYAVHELDETYKTFHEKSRYFTTTYEGIDKALAIQIARTYGDLLDPNYANGHKDSQLLLGFHHNTPDNTLGIIWEDTLVHGTGIPWSPAFKRYPKIYGAP